MNILLYLIMALAAIMIILYIIAFITKSSRMLIAFRLSMLVLIATLGITFIISLCLKQPFYLLLGLAILFIVLYIFT